MQGFKSFADKIELQFGKGITAIVGPNGSGKSNVSDAIRWVMGEQSAKSLRGSKMEDVIFSGTQNRKPLGFAEVSIILDNTDRCLKIDFDEVTVTRRVHRSGEGEYFINKSPCRLRDIYELFMDTGIGREGYSVVGQGKIDEILSSKSEDRRHIFEEAAGISKYKYRKIEAEKKLNQTEENLIRIKDILSELSSQVGPLKIQSEKAKKYLDLREVLKVLEINIAIVNIEKYKANVQKCNNDLKIALEQLEESKKAQVDIDNEQEKLNTLSQEKNAEIAKINEQKFELEKSEGGFLNKIELLKNEILHNNENIERLKNDNKELEEKISAIDDDNKKKDDESENLKNLILELENHIEKLIGESNLKKEEYDKIFDDIEAKKGDIIELLNENTNYSASYEGLNTLEKNFSEREESITVETSVTKDALSENEKRLKECKESIEENQKTASECKEKLDVLKNEYFKIVKDNDNIKAHQNIITTEYNAKSSKKKALEDLEKGYEGYARGVKEIINDKVSGVLGVVSKLITVSDNYVIAIETALGRALQNIVVEDEESAKKCIEKLKNSKGGRATFLPLTSVNGEVMKNAPEKEKGYIGIASNLIEFDARFDGIFKSLLGKTVIVDNIDNAIYISKKYGYKFKIVTLDGQVLNAGGSITGGSSDKNASLLSRSKNIESLAKDIEKLEKTIDKNDNLIYENNQKIKEISVKKEELDLKNNQSANNLVRLEAEEKHLLEDIKKLTEKLNLLGGEMGDIKSQIKEIDKNRNQLLENQKINDEKIVVIRGEITNLDKKLIDVQNKKDETDNLISEEKLNVSGMEKDLEFINSNIKSNQAAKDEFLIKLDDNNAQIDDYNSKNSSSNKNIEEIEKNMHGTKEIFEEFKIKLEEKKKENEKILEDIKKAREKSKENQDVVLVLAQEVTRCENKVAKAEADIENVINKLWDDYEITFSDAQSYKKDIENFAEAQREAASLKRQIKELGNINIDAIEEYKAVSERFEFLSNQENDLNTAKKNLLDIIDEMQTVMKEKFTVAFNLISEEFKRVFVDLFGGGIAKIYLADESDILNSGIEIEVQPPGKKLQNLTLLSGGERAFSAIALLFAVLKCAPTPFCLLDEVEAALDEANVYKFANYAKKYAGKTQFLIVTHRRGTMETADILYGVTMQEKGVSKLLKLNFTDLEDSDV
ncbi:MAG: chromosome segregation protein SMC [Ruminococcaceae bacterium]|nr:chromosome segregation protein SMC [Oscillospiraceae bacterium]